MNKKLSDFTPSELREYLKKYSNNFTDDRTTKIIENSDRIDNLKKIYKEVKKLCERLGGKILTFSLDPEKPHGFIVSEFDIFTLAEAETMIFSEIIKLCDRIEITTTPNEKIAVLLQVENIFVKDDSNMQNNFQLEKSCGGIIYRGTDDSLEILLIRHVKGHWTFPKGHVEEGETEEETAHREVLEETSLNVEIDSSFRYIIEYSPKKGVTKTVVYFLATYISGQEQAQLSEVSEVGWYNVKDVEKMLTFKNDKNILRAALKHIRDNR